MRDAHAAFEESLQDLERKVGRLEGELREQRSLCGSAERQNASLKEDLEVSKRRESLLLELLRYEQNNNLPIRRETPQGRSRRSGDNPKRDCAKTQQRRDRKGDKTVPRRKVGRAVSTTLARFCTSYPMDPNSCAVSAGRRRWILQDTRSATPYGGDSRTTSTTIRPCPGHAGGFCPK